MGDAEEIIIEFASLESVEIKFVARCRDAETRGSERANAEGEGEVELEGVKPVAKEGKRGGRGNKWP